MVVLWSGPLFYVFYVLVFYPKSLHSSLVQGVEWFFVFGLLFLSQYKDTQLSCVFEKKKTQHLKPAMFKMMSTPKPNLSICILEWLYAILKCKSERNLLS